jgi:hypothetical protein
VGPVVSSIRPPRYPHSLAVAVLSSAGSSSICIASMLLNICLFILIEMILINNLQVQL